MGIYRSIENSTVLKPSLGEQANAQVATYQTCNPLAWRGATDEMGPSDWWILFRNDQATTKK
jgi:hypothetical protein